MYKFFVEDNQIENNEVKKYADYITLSNEEKGVAVFLEKLLKNEI